MGVATYNWLCFLAACLINFLFCRAYLPADQPTVISEAIGLTIVMAMPAFFARQWLKQPRAYHAYTLLLAIALAAGRYYSEAH